MTKKQILFCGIFLFSQICMATIIIDVAVKVDQVVPYSISPGNCTSAGCSYSWVDGKRLWINIYAPSPSTNYMPFTILMEPSSTTGPKHIKFQEANSTSEIRGVCLALPGLHCGQNGSSGEESSCMQLHRYDGLIVGEVCFILDGNGNFIVHLSPDLISQGYALSGNTGVSIEGGGINDGTSGMQSGPSDSNNELYVGAESTDRGTQNVDAAPVIQVSPNPFSQNINVRVMASAEETINIELLNANGQIFRRQTYVGKQDEFPFQTQDVPLGCYFLRVQAGDRVYLNRVVKVE